MFDDRPAKESPLSRKPTPLRTAGQSLAEHIEEIQNDRMMYWVWFILVVWSWAMLDWFFWFTQAPRNPLVSTSLASLGTGFAFWRNIVWFRRLKRVRQGLDGERYVGEVLEKFRARGFTVLHDIPGPHGNVDHVLIGPEGVFAVETKNISRPTSGTCEIIYDGASVVIPGARMDRDFLGQATACAKRVHNLLKEETGEDIYVRPVLIFAGWYISRRVKGPTIWVVNENHLEAYLDHEPARLSPEQVTRYALKVSRYARV